MAPTPSSKPNQMASTPSSKSNQTTHLRTPQSKHRLNFNNTNIARPSPNPNSTTTAAAEHPVEVIGRIRDYPDRKDKLMPPSTLQINPDRQSLRVRTDIGYRDFSLDGVSLSEEEDLEAFYKKFVESRINGVKLGDKCTIMMYGPTGAGKSHTMFGCPKQPGIVYRSLKDILGEGNEGGEESGEKIGAGTFVQVTVLEIYNEEIYDLLSTNNGGGFSLGWPKGSASKVKLEVMGKKAKNATFIAGHEAGKISKEIQKVEKRRIVKSTLCNERSSRSHCMVILDVPTVGGRLMLVDMAGSENIEQAGQNGLEAKMQTAKINQGNIALKRVVESIANGDSHVPFRDSKLTMLLQDSFEDDKSKILMILCASPDPKELHKTIATLEYGAKAKCIVRGPHTPIKENGAEDSSSAVILGSRIAAMDQFIYKLQMENKLREKERNEAKKELMKKEEEMSALRAKLALAEGKGLESSEEEINLKVIERTQKLKNELENKIQECQKMTDKFVEMERRKMEERIFQQQQEVEMLRRRLEEIEFELWRSKSERGSIDLDGSSFAKRLLEIYPEESGMVKSMDLDKSIDMDVGKRDSVTIKSENNGGLSIMSYSNVSNSNAEEGLPLPTLSSRAYLSTVYEEEEDEEDGDDHKGNPLDEEVQKEVIEEKTVCSSTAVDNSNSSFNLNVGSFTTSPLNFVVKPHLASHERHSTSGFISDHDSAEDSASSRQMRIQNIFTLCGNYRELSQHRITLPSEKKLENFDSPSPLRTIEEDSASKMLGDVSELQKSVSKKDMVVLDEIENEKKLTENQMLIVRGSDDVTVHSKENFNPLNEGSVDLKVYVKWEASKENPGKVITTLNVVKDATLADLRKLIEIHLGADNQAFSFLVLGDPSGAPVPREKEATTPTSKLPICNNQLIGHLACLRPVKTTKALTHPIPFSPLENILPVTPKSHFKAQQGDGFSPKLAEHLSTTPFVTCRKY